MYLKILYLLLTYGKYGILEGVSLSADRASTVNFGDVGVISLNGELKEECQDCLWREWDSLNDCCSNCANPVCPIFRQQLLSREAGGPLPS